MTTGETPGTRAGVDARELLDVAVLVARAGAALARARRVAGVAGVRTKSTDTDLVTAADRAVERRVVALLRRHRPADAILGEEFGAESGAEVGAESGAEFGVESGGAARPGPGGRGERGRVRWLVDPIDGTVNYVYGIPLYAISVAAQVDGATVAGVVRNAASGEEWTARLGGGAWRDRRRLRGSRVDDLGHALVATGFGYAAATRAHQARVVAAVLPRVRDIRRLGTAALDLCYAAEGRVDAFYESGLNEWDFAAGALIATEAGLRVSGLGGAPAGAAMVLAAPPILFGPLHDLLERLDAAGSG